MTSFGTVTTFPTADVKLVPHEPTVATRMSPSSKECELKPPFGFCNDYIFSGHSAFNIVSSYHIGSPLWPVWPAVTSLFSIASREHYSVDVVIAWIIFAAMKSKL